MSEAGAAMSLGRSVRLFTLFDRAISAVERSLQIRRFQEVGRCRHKDKLTKGRPAETGLSVRATVYLGRRLAPGRSVQWYDSPGHCHQDPYSLGLARGFGGEAL